MCPVISIRTRDTLTLVPLNRYNILADTPAAPLFTLEQCEQTSDHAVQWPDIIRTTLDIEQAFHPDNITPGYYKLAGLSS